MRARLGRAGGIAEAIGQRFDDAGFEFYLVGGLVRDYVMGLDTDESHDIDGATDATPEETIAVMDGFADFASEQGARYGTVAVRVGGETVEITTFRSETYRAGSRKPEVVFSDDIRVDLSRRDLTMNAMAMRVPGWELFDPFGGAGDIAAGVLRTPSDPRGLFHDDPLRMLRVARFSARFGFEAGAELIRAICNCARRISIIASERIGAELSVILSLESPRAAVDMMCSTGLLSSWLAGEGFSVGGARGIGYLPDSAGGRWAAVLGSCLGRREAVAMMRHRLSVSSEEAKEAEQILRASEAIAELESSWRGEVSQARRMLGNSASWHCVEEALCIRHGWGLPVNAAAEATLRETERLDGQWVREAVISGHEIVDMIGAGPRVGHVLNALREMQYERGQMSGDEIRTAARELAFGPG